MRHHRLITRRPETAQIEGTTTLEVKVQFMVEMVDRVIVFVFQTWGGSMI